MFTRLRTITVQAVPPTTTVPPTETQTVGDPYWDQVVLLMHMDNAELKDEKSHPATISGTVQYNTEFKKFDTGSAKFIGTSYLSFADSDDWNFASRDFTIEFNVMISAYAQYATVMGQWYSSNSWLLQFKNTTGELLLYTTANTISLGTIGLNTFHHVAVVRNGTKILSFIDGVLTGTTEIGTFIFVNSSQPLFIGGTASGYYFNGYLDEVRITNGVARYTTDFTPPSAAFPSNTELNIDYFWPQTKLLLKATGATITDESSTTGLVLDGVTTKDLAKVSGYSIYFNGASKLTLNNPSAFSFGTSDFTIESWIYVNSYASYAAIIDLGSSSISSRFCLYLASGKLQITTSSDLTAATKSGPTNSWTHVAVVRRGGILTYYVNGNACGTISLPNNFACPSARLGKSWADTYPFTGYMQDFRVTKYARYSGNFTPKTNSTFGANSPGADGYLPAALQTLDFDPYWYSNTTLVMPLTSNLSDLKGNVITANSITGVVSDTAKFSTQSLKLTGTGYLSTPYSSSRFNWWLSDFTIECWINISSLASLNGGIPCSFGGVEYSTLIGNMSPATLNSHWSFGPISNSKLAFSYWNSSSLSTVVSASDLSLGNWHHIAMTKATDGIRLFINGEKPNDPVLHTGTPTEGGSYPLLVIGRLNNTGIQAYVQDLRMTKGVARYLQNFTPAGKPNPTCGASF